MTRYIGTKLIEAEPQKKDGKDGYKVCYPDGYVSWSPEDVFEGPVVGSRGPFGNGQEGAVAGEAFFGLPVSSSVALGRAAK